MTPNRLRFCDFRKANVIRCEQSFRPLDAWNPLEWAGALCGEAGEAANLAKKIRRGDFFNGDDAKTQLAKELADVVTYADLLAASMGIDLAQAVVDKFNEVSDRVGSMVRLA